MGTTRVKICGLSEPVTLAAAIDAGAAYVGFVFVEKSPRFVTLQQAAPLAQSVKPGVAKVGLTVNATDDELTAITDAVPLDMIQLHGSETPERVADVKARFGLPVMKAIGMASSEDLDKLPAFEAVADQILLDAKPPKDGDLPGGNGLTFDWRLIAGRRWPIPWMLAGGLTPENVDEAVRLTGARQVDLSSSLETSPGVKDEGLIRAFMAACP